MIRHLTMGELEAGLEAIRQSPRDGGVVEMIARRPEEDQREVIEECELDPERGVVGDNWSLRGRSGDRPPNRATQVTVMNARAVQLVSAGDRGRWAMAGDQLFVDLDLGIGNLPPGTRLEIGGAEIEVSPEPHTGCRKFAARYGRAAMDFVNSEVGRQMNLRGINARIVKGGRVRVGDAIRVIPGVRQPAHPRQGLESQDRADVPPPVKYRFAKHV